MQESLQDDFLTFGGSLASLRVSSFTAFLAGFSQGPEKFLLAEIDQKFQTWFRLVAIHTEAISRHGRNSRRSENNNEIRGVPDRESLICRVVHCSGCFGQLFVGLTFSWRGKNCKPCSKVRIVCIPWPFKAEDSCGGKHWLRLMDRTKED